MNKKISVVLAILFSSLLTMFFYFGVGFQNRNIIAKTTEKFREKTEKEIYRLVNQARNDLVQGNIRAGRIKIAQGINNDILDFEILQNKSPLLSNGHSNSIDSFSLTVPVYFGTADDEIWGNVQFLVSNREILNLKHTLSSSLNQTALILWFVVILLIGLIYIVAEKTSNKLQDRFVASFSDHFTGSPKSFFDLLWAPFLDSISEKSIVFKKNQKDLSNLKEQELLYSVYYKIAHDIKSPIGAIETISRQDNSLPAAQKSLLQSAVKRMKELTEKYLIEHKKKTVAINSLADLNSVIDDAVNLFLNHKLTFDLENSLNTKEQIQYNPIGLKNILINLFKNSFEANSSLVKVRLKDSGGFLRIEIRDDGSGIAADDFEKILSGSYTTKAQGNGIGLSSSKRLIQSWGGQLKLIESESGAHIVIDLLC